MTTTRSCTSNRPAADQEPTLTYATRIAPGLGPGRNQLKIRMNSHKLVQNNPSSLNRNKGISVILNKFKVVAATAVLEDDEEEEDDDEEGEEEDDGEEGEDD